MHIKAQPVEQAPADFSMDGQLQVGLVTGQLADFFLVVVGVEEVREREPQADDEQQESEQYQAQDFAERFHGQSLNGCWSEWRWSIRICRPRSSCSARVCGVGFGRA